MDGRTGVNRGGIGPYWHGLLARLFSGGHEEWIHNVISFSESWWVGVGMGQLQGN